VSSPRFLPVGEGEQRPALATLVSAFVEDPVMRWLYPAQAHYEVAFPQLLTAFGGGAFSEGTAWRLDEFAAVALWMPPGAESADEPIIAVFNETVAPPQHEDLFSVLEQMDAAHPKFPHWYLPWFGVDSTLQGHGLGSELMRRRCSTSRVSGDSKPTQYPVLRTARVRGHRDRAGRRVSPGVVHGEASSGLAGQRPFA
jgi:hypothetical protein